MQEQEGGRWGVGEKNKRRIGGEGRELKRKRKRVRRVTPLRKGRKEHRHEREREERLEISHIFYIRGYPRLILGAMRKKESPKIKEREGYCKTLVLFA